MDIHHIRTTLSCQSTPHRSSMVSTLRRRADQGLDGQNQDVALRRVEWQATMDRSMRQRQVFTEGQATATSSPHHPPQCRSNSFILYKLFHNTNLYTCSCCFAMHNNVHLTTSTHTTQPLCSSTCKYYSLSIPTTATPNTNHHTHQYTPAPTLPITILPNFILLPTQSIRPAQRTKWCIIILCMPTSTTITTSMPCLPT